MHELFYQGRAVGFDCLGGELVVDHDAVLHHGHVAHEFTVGGEAAEYFHVDTQHETARVLKFRREEEGCAGRHTLQVNALSHGLVGGAACRVVTVSDVLGPEIPARRVRLAGPRAPGGSGPHRPVPRRVAPPGVDAGYARVSGRARRGAGRPSPRRPPGRPAAPRWPPSGRRPSARLGRRPAADQRLRRLEAGPGLGRGREGGRRRRSSPSWSAVSPASSNAAPASDGGKGVSNASPGPRPSSQRAQARTSRGLTWPAAIGGGIRGHGRRGHGPGPAGR